MIASELTIITTTANNSRIEKKNVCSTVANEFKTTSLISIIFISLTRAKISNVPVGLLGQNSAKVTGLSAELCSEIQYFKSIPFWVYLPKMYPNSEGKGAKKDDINPLQVLNIDVANFV